MEYDRTNKKSIETHANNLVGESLRKYLPKDYVDKEGKGYFGQLLEKYYFEYNPNSDSGPDFPEAGIELKSTGIISGKRTGLRAKERLTLNIINYLDIIDEKWEDSTFRKKNSLILLVFYMYEKGMLSMDYLVHMVELFGFGNHEYDYEIIRKDWEFIVAKIKAGKAHELSEGDTMYLGACTKGATAAGSERKQPKSSILAKQRAFSFKQGYMNALFKRFSGKRVGYEKLFDTPQVQMKSFEEKLQELFCPYIGKTASEIGTELGIKSKAKSHYHLLSKKILGVKSEKNIEEFNKADITMRTIRIKPSGLPAEDISFPAFKFKELLLEDIWEESELYSLLEGNKFLFVVYRMKTKTLTEFENLKDDEIDDNLILDKVVLWNAPIQDIDLKAKITWEDTKKIIKEGVEIKEKSTKRGTVYKNNLPSKSQTEMIHVRPHGINRDDTDTLPDGRELTKQCFWFNGDYIAKQLGTI